MVNWVLIGWIFYVYYNFDCDMFVVVEVVYGFLVVFFVDKLCFFELVEDLFEFIVDLLLVVYNVGFDFGFFNVELVMIGCEVVCCS